MDSGARLQATIDSMLDPHVYVEAIRDEGGGIVDFVYLDANEAACRYNGRTRSEMIGARLMDILPGHAATGILADYARVVDTGEPIIADDLRYFNEILQQERRSDLRCIRVGDRLSVTWRDVTERYEAADALARSEELYRLLADHTSDVVARLRDGLFEWVSSSVTSALGWLPDDLLGQANAAFVHVDDLATFEAGFLRLEAGNKVRLRYRFRASNGIFHWLDSHGGPLIGADGSSDGYVLSMRIVNSEVRAQRELEAQARRDHLTGLPNREAAFADLAAILRRAPRTGPRTAVVFCDVDRFKAINDTFGHAGGDEVLRVQASRLRSSVRMGDLVARIGGDELLVVLDGVHSLEQAVALSENLRIAASMPIELQGGAVRATMSMGVALAIHGGSLDDVVAHADEAMYRAKEHGRDQVVAYPFD